MRVSEDERERWDDREVESEWAHEQRALEACFDRMLMGEACSCAYHEGEVFSLAFVQYEAMQRELELRAAEAAFDEAARKMERARGRFERAAEAERVRTAVRDLELAMKRSVKS